MSETVIAFLDPEATRVLKSSDHGSAFLPIPVYAAEKKDNAEVPVNKGFAAFFEFRKKNQEVDQPPESESSEGSGILKSFSKWREGRKLKDKEKLNEIGDTQNTDKKSIGWKTIESRKEKDSKTKAVFERERIRKYQAEINADGSGSDRIASTNNVSESTLTKFNPVSAAQKLLSVVSNKQKSSKEEWIIVASKTSIAPGALVPISAAGLDLLLVASKDGSALHCIANSCSHLGTPLEIGTLERRPIENTNFEPSNDAAPSSLQENYLAKLLAQDGCEDCIICPLHKTAFALESGEVRGEWCPYPPVVGKVVGTIKPKSALPVFDVRTKGKNIEVRINTPIRVDGE
ncbi:unnamed protein product [Cylindrotheca closterium]|uniref:Rieske domain-containing protein n=1 Tax=Cylindrotheca closterium TaxID=2856 RepID=A0AAD2G325_9STRA|nr:unnamed protein product [Cylindrotheca closterium]